MEINFLHISNEILQSLPFCHKTARLRTDAFVFLYPVLLTFLFLTGRKKSQNTTTHTTGKQSIYLSLTLFLNTITAFIINIIIKFFINRPRPYKALGLPTPTEDLTLQSVPIDSFPSDHAAVSMTIATTLLFWGYKTKNRNIQTLGRGFLLIALLMGRGRVAIAIHWPTDILAGFMIGASIAYITTAPIVQGYLIIIRDWILKIRNHIISRFFPHK